MNLINEVVTVCLLLIVINIISFIISDFLNKKTIKNTKENIEDGQKFMSMGLMAGVRNPLAHEEKKELKTTNLFSEKDCLDILSLISHLFRRLDDAEKLE